MSVVLFNLLIKSEVPTSGSRIISELSTSGCWIIVAMSFELIRNRCTERRDTESRRWKIQRKKKLKRSKRDEMGGGIVNGHVSF
ncbi:hypothetical protein EUTSA_v10000403mg [Eutrema salsugineum]|uniref:Uncharacterized protein n=1 Tax=Eutrema salsugineum TaxID=72664 RepID=V4LVN0_EUTSA|nr:hypothetical protein EUTSA_v10000403mg [Eutrema salsugineum]